PQLTTAPWLNAVATGHLDVTGNPRLRVPESWTVALLPRNDDSHVNTASAIRIGDLPGLRELAIDGVAIGAVALERTGLRTARIRSPTSALTLASGLLRVLDNPELGTLQLDGAFPSLRTVEIIGNPALPACRAQAILDFLTADEEVARDNDDDGVCP